MIKASVVFSVLIVYVVTQELTYQSFPTIPSDLVLNGDCIVSDIKLKLNLANTASVGSVWTNYTLDFTNGFETDFVFDIIDQYALPPFGSVGFVFGLQNDPASNRAIGATAQSVGFTTLKNAAGVAFEWFQIQSPQVKLAISNVSMSDQSGTSLNTTFNSTTPMSVQITYDAKIDLVQAWVNDSLVASTQLPILSLIGNSSARVGFTASSGGQFEGYQRHEIQSWHVKSYQKDENLAISCSSNFEVYINGNLTGTGSNRRYTYSFKVPKWQTGDILGIKALTSVDTSIISNCIVEVKFGGNFIGSSSQWRSGAGISMATQNWTQSNFDDSNWYYSVSLGTNDPNSPIFRRSPGIDSSTSRIWSPEKYRDAYFRFKLPTLCQTSADCVNFQECSNGLCQCTFPPFYGDMCQYRIELVCPGNCSQNGICDGKSGNCTCNSGWSGSACTIPDCPGTPDCGGSSHGTCQATAGTAPTCQCQVNQWEGPDCSQAICPGNCSGNGYCSEFASPPACVCDDGWDGSDCSVQVENSTCAGTPTCSNHGVCNDTICQCDENWTGSGCDVPLCEYSCNGQGTCDGSTDLPTCRCLNGYSGNFCEISPPCLKNCSANGQCRIIGNNTFACDCNSPWEGSDCSLRVFQCLPCRNGGSCNGTTGTCICPSAFTGAMCTTPILSSSISSTDASSSSDSNSDTDTDFVVTGTVPQSSGENLTSGNGFEVGSFWFWVTIGVAGLAVLVLISSIVFFGIRRARKSNRGDEFF